MSTKIVTFVFTDGFGTFQGRCSCCNWRGPWHRKEPKAIADASAHGEAHQ